MEGKFSSYINDNMKNKSVGKYMDNISELHDITDGMKKTIDMLEKDELKVVGIHVDSLNLCGDIVPMTVYIYSESYDSFPEGELENSIKVNQILYEDRVYYNCYVENEAWDIQEFGSVRITDLLDGRVRRSA